MFYAHFVLAKKGPLARIWLAAHWDKKITKAHVFETNIESSVEGILQPKAKMALRTSGHLLLGIVRIFSRKAKYLLADCNEAFIKIKMAFRPGVVDLPEAAREAAVSTITLPEVFHDFDNVADVALDIDEQVTLNQSRAEDITLKEDYGHLNLITDDGFEEWHEPEIAREATNIEEGFENTSLLLEEQCKETTEEIVQNNTSISSKPSLLLSGSLRDDGFGGTVGEGLLDGETGGLFEPAGLFDDAPLDNVALENPEHLEAAIDKSLEEHDDDSDDVYDMGPGSTGAPSPPSSPESEPTEKAPEPDVTGLQHNNNIDNLLDINPPSSVVTSDAAASDILPTVPEIPPPPASCPPADHTTLINNEDESFALAPLDTTIIQGAEKTVKAKRKRKLIVDEVKNISGEEMKSQLSDATDIVTTLDLAPPTKRLMHWKETGGVEKLFALPGIPILSSKLSSLYQKHLTSRSVDNEEFGTEDDFHIDLDVDIEQPRERDESENSIVPPKRPRMADTNQMYPQDITHLDTLHLDASHPSFNSSDHPIQVTHPSLDIPNFIQQQMLCSEQQMINSVIQHPPQAHMIQQMLQTSIADVNQLAHLPDMMHHTMVNHGTPLHSMTSSIHNIPNIPSPIVSEVYNQRIVHPIIEPEHAHLLANRIPDQLHQMSIDKQMLSHSPMPNQLSQFQDQLSQPNVVTNIIENNLRSCNEKQNEMMPHLDGHMLQPPVDEDVTQPCLAEDYTHAIQPNTLSNTISGNEKSHVIQIPEPSSENTSLQTEINQIAPEEESNVFDSLNSDAFRLTQNNQFQQNENTDLQKNEFMSDDDDDYGAPSSVGPLLPEEQMADETYEQFEERILTKRTTKMLHVINNKLDQDHNVSFADVVRNHKRKQVAQKFYTFLVLKKQQAIELEQNSSYGDLVITKGPKFSAVYNGN